MATIDERWKGINKPVARVEVPTITCPNGASAEVTEDVPLNMTVKTIVVRIGTATNGDETYTLKIRDDNGAEHLSKATLPDATKTVLNSTKATADFDEFCLNGIVTVGITPSGDPGDSGVDVSVDLIGV